MSQTRFVLVTAVVVTLLSPSLARADLVIPERAACAGKKAGDACEGGVCESAGHECQSGSCRQFDGESECTKNGCSWVEELRCAAAAPPTPATTAPVTPAPSTEAPRAAPPASCASTPTMVGSGALVALLLLRRRRRW